MDINNKLEIAEELLSLGFSLVPVAWPVNGGCSCGRAECQAPGKHPIIKNWPNSWSKEFEQVREWLKKWPQANLGIVTGKPSNLFVLDIDRHAAGSDGMESLEDLEALHGKLPDTWTVLTGGGGLQLYFKYPSRIEHIPNAVSIAPGLDIRADGGQVVAPGSLHKSGNYYEWEISSAPDVVPMAELPGWLLNIVIGSDKKKKKSGAKKWADQDAIGEGQRNDYITSRAGSLRRLGFNADSMLAALLEENSARCSPPLPDNEIQRIVESISKKEPGQFNNLACTDIGNSERFIKQHGANVSYCRTWKKNFIWNGKYFEEDTTGRIMELAKSTVRKIPEEAQGITDENAFKQLLKWAMQSQARDRLRSMVDLAVTDGSIAARPEDFDKSPWLLNTLTGIIDLKTGNQLPHDRKYMFTNIVPVQYLPGACCPRWLQFLSEIFQGNVELIDFVQRAIGYSLTGDTSEQVLFLLYGTGANGKSTFINTLAELVGPYHRQAASTAFLQSKYDNRGEELAPLVSSRLVTIVEVEQGRRLAENLIKQATGGDLIRCRFLYSNSFEFKPQFKLWMAVNHKPKATGNDPAIWRRLRLIPFNVQFKDKQQDKHLVDKLRSELPGILAWAVQGCLKWQREGLEAPSLVTNATDEWRQENDAVGQFFTDCLLVRPLIKCRVRDLYAAYEVWSAELGEPALSQRRLNQELRNRGYDTITSTGNQAYWQGLGLLEHQNQEVG